VVLTEAGLVVVDELYKFSLEEVEEKDEVEVGDGGVEVAALVGGAWNKRGGGDWGVGDGL
jgi:hypothetical protein